MSSDKFKIANRSFTSRLFLGTGKFASPQLMKDAIEASGSEMITTAVRRIDLTNPNDTFIAHIDPKKYLFLPNTSGARTAEEAIRIARLARATGVSDWVKLEVTPEPNHLLPDPIETLIAAEQLVKEGFVVLPYINADPVLAKRLEEIGCATVMPLAAPIGSNKGLHTRDQIQLIIQQSKIPVIVDAGLGAPSHAAEAMELGADAVLVNTAIATASNPIEMATAFKWAVIAGRLGYLAGLPSTQQIASASSPLTGFLHLT
ncbi:MAG: thiazole synthase [Candidatus Margulisbacteria bacterium]|nr:thiazole synthase [Candidatus Margulisiibacteriota bacterium]